MRALFNHRAILKYDDLICPHHSRETMGNRQRGSAWQYRIKRQLHFALRLCIKRTSGFVEQQNRRIFQDGTRN